MRKKVDDFHFFPLCITANYILEYINLVPDEHCTDVWSCFRLLCTGRIAKWAPALKTRMEI